MIQFNCTGCGKALKVKDEFAGKRAKCPKCGLVVEIPRGQSTQKPSEAPPPTPEPRTQSPSVRTSPPAATARQTTPKPTQTQAHEAGDSASGGEPLARIGKRKIQCPLCKEIWAKPYVSMASPHQIFKCNRCGVRVFAGELAKGTYDLSFAHRLPLGTLGRYSWCIAVVALVLGPLGAFLWPFGSLGVWSKILLTVVIVILGIAAAVVTYIACEEYRARLERRKSTHRESWMARANVAGIAFALKEWATLVAQAGCWVNVASRNIALVANPFDLLAESAGGFDTLRLMRFETGVKNALPDLKSAKEALSMRHAPRFLEVAEYDQTRKRRLAFAGGELHVGIDFMIGNIELACGFWRERSKDMGIKLSSSEAYELRRVGGKLSDLLWELAPLLAHIGTKQYVEWLFEQAREGEIHEARWGSHLLAVPVRHAILSIGDAGAGEMAFSFEETVDVNRVRQWFVDQLVQAACKDRQAAEKRIRSSEKSGFPMTDWRIENEYCYLHSLLSFTRETPNGAAFLTKHSNVMASFATDENPSVRSLGEQLQSHIA